MSNFIWSQTALKDIENVETCQFRWKSQWMDKSFTSPSSEDTDRGKYFEQLLLGSSASSQDRITDLPRLTTGAKSTDQLRIEAQAERGKRILFDPNDSEYLGFRIVSTQLPLRVESRQGVLDIVAHDTENNVWVIDVKLTKDLTNTRTVYGWGNDMRTMDLIQFPHYRDLYAQSMGDVPKMGVLIFDYSPEKRIKFVEIVCSQDKLDEKDARFLGAQEVIDLYEKRGWIKTPSERECDRCPLTCSQRKLKSKLIKDSIIY